MPHFLVTSAIVVALLAILGTAIGACMGIARDLMLDGAEDDRDEEPTTAGNGRISLPGEFDVSPYGRHARRN
jgi:hypothetical protein